LVLFGFAMPPGNAGPFRRGARFDFRSLPQNLPIVDPQCFLQILHRFYK